MPVVDGMDKVVHFFMYLVLTVACVLDIHFNKNSLSDKIKISYCILFPILLGGILEILQWKFTVSRSGDWFDMLADTLGVVVGYFLMRLLMNGNKTSKQNNKDK